LDFVTISSR